jgi:pilus assembly protein FimV
MLRRLSRTVLMLVALFSSQVWALGLGDIRLDSALNEPLRAEIQLLSATPEELSNLTILMASAETFDRYGLDRPVYLQDIEFMIINGVIEVRSRLPITEPFITFLVDASWSRGRLLREYTILLDPPTFAPPTQSAPVVTAPQRNAPADSGRIERESAPTPQPQTSPAPVQSRPPVRSDPEPQPVSDDSSDSSPSDPVSDDSSDSSPYDNVSYDSTSGDNVVAERGQTLWGITQRVKPDSRLTMNQTMLAIFEANPGAFGGNINVMRAGGSLRIPSADEIFRIGRGDALSEVLRQNAAWTGGTVVAPSPVEPAPQPSLQLVPPDDDIVLDDGADDSATDFGSDLGDEPLTREAEIEQEIAELEAADVPEQRSLIEIRDNDLATLRAELSRIRGEVYDPSFDSVDGEDEPVDDSVTDDVVVDPDDIVADDTTDDAIVDDQVTDAVDETPTTNVVTTRVSSKPGLVDQVIAALTSMWAVIGGAIVLVLGLLVWFMRRDRDEDDESGAWNALDED